MRYIDTLYLLDCTMKLFLDTSNEKFIFKSNKNNQRITVNKDWYKTNFEIDGIKGNDEEVFYKK